jgi:hypothetical protein
MSGPIIRVANSAGNKNRKRTGKGSMTAGKVIALVKEVLEKSDPKYFDAQANYYYLSYSGSIVALSGMGQGSTALTRSGNNVMANNIELRYTAYFLPSATATQNVQNVLRVVIIQWHNNDSSFPVTMAEVFQYSGSNYGSAINSPFLFQNTGVSEKIFTVLYDRRHLVGPSPTGCAVDHIINLNKSHLSYDNASGTGANMYYMLAFSDDGSGLNAYPEFSYWSRLHYTDT